MHPLARPAPEEPCLCGSGKISIDCCAGPGTGQAPRNVVIQRGYLGTEDCHRLVEYAVNAARDPMMQDTPTGRIRSEQRIGYLVDTRSIDGELYRVVARAFEHHAEACGVNTIAWLQRPQLLAYEPGGRYITHADADADAWDERAGCWRKVADRDVSLLLYLDDRFEGGALYFPRFDFRIKPEAGMLVMFPSDARYAHCAEPVVHGRRHVIVSWAAARGVARVQDAPPQDAVRVGP